MPAGMAFPTDTAAEHKASAAMGREGLPQIEYPSPFLIKNTFIDTATDLSHLDSFYEARTIRSTPAVVMEKDLDCAIPPKSDGASTRSTSVGSCCSRSGTDDKSPYRSPEQDEVRPAPVERARSGRVLEEFDYPTPVFVRHTFLHFGFLPLSDAPGKARSCPVSGVNVPENSDDEEEEEEEPPFMSIFGAAESSRRGRKENLPPHPEQMAESHATDDEEGESIHQQPPTPLMPTRFPLLSPAPPQLPIAAQGCIDGESTHSRLLSGESTHQQPPTPLMPTRSPLLSPTSPKLPIAMQGCLDGQQPYPIFIAPKHTPTSMPPLKSPELAARLPQRSPASPVLPLAPRGCLAGQSSSAQSSPSSCSHAPTPVLKSPELAARLPRPKGFAPRTPQELRLSEVLREPTSALLPPERKADALPSASALALSMGSIAHDLGICKPCAHAHKPQGCRNGDRCPFCHLCPPGELKRKQRAKRAAYRAGLSETSSAHWARS